MLQLFVILEGDGDLTSGVGTACHLNLHIEELTHTVSEDTVFQRQLGRGLHLLPYLLQGFTALEHLYHLLHLSDGVAVFLYVLE